MYKKLMYFVFLALVLALVTFIMKRWFHKGEEKATMPTSERAERTLAIIKPEAVAAGHVDSIIKMIKDNNFTILREEKVTLTREQAECFYGVHKGKPFFEELVNMMTSGPIVVMALEKVNAIKAWRDLMGNTNPAKAAPGTIRNLYGTSIGSNATHGSDAPETAATELKFFFSDL
jgi:nucleoside-diphosphate kinase